MMIEVPGKIKKTFQVHKILPQRQTKDTAERKSYENIIYIRAINSIVKLQTFCLP